MPEEAEPARAGAGAAAVPRLDAFNCFADNRYCGDRTAGDAFIGGVDQAIAGVDSVVDEAFDSGFIDLLGR